MIGLREERKSNCFFFFPAQDQLFLFQSLQQVGRFLERKTGKVCQFPECFVLADVVKMAEQTAFFQGEIVFCGLWSAAGTPEAFGSGTGP